MIVKINTSYIDLLNELQSRLTRQFQDNYYGIFLVDIGITENVRGTVVDTISNNLLSNNKLNLVVPVTTSFQIILQNTRVYEYQFDYIHMDIEIELVKDYSNKNYVDLIKSIQKTFFKYNLELKQLIGDVSDFNMIPTTEYHKIKFITMSPIYFDIIKDSIGSQFYVKKPSYNNIDSIIDYYIDRDKRVYDVYETILKNMENNLNKYEFYLHRDKPVYKYKLNNDEYLYISITFCVIFTKDNNLIVLYDYKDKKSVYSIEEDLKSLYVDIEGIYPLLNLYKYN